jgi:hypothetical protein
MKITARPNINLELHFSINEKEARGLNALTCYDIEQFLKIFKQYMGKHYIEKDGAEEGLREFFKECYQKTSGYLAKLDEAKRVFNT